MNLDVHQTTLPKLVDQVKAGQTVTLEEDGKPIATLLPTHLPQTNEERKPGAMKGKIHIHDNFDDPLPTEIAAALGMEPQ